VKSISTIEALNATDASSSRARKRGAFLTASSINPLRFINLLLDIHQDSFMH
jgi:hypothetical protein